MTPVIRISDDTFQRLKAWAEPLVDTADDALRKVLDAAEKHGLAVAKPVSSPPRSERNGPVVSESPKDMPNRNPAAPDSADIAPARPARAASAKTPERGFYRPIIEALRRLGGRGHTVEVYKELEPSMNLGQADYEDVPSGGDMSWQNTARFARLRLIQSGYLRPDSPHGIWELTDKGKQAADSKASVEVRRNK